MRLILPVFNLLVFISAVFAQTSTVDLEGKSADLILVNEQVEFVISDRKNSTYQKQYELILNNSYAKSHRNIYIYYDQFRTVENANVIVKSLNGKIISKYKLKDFEDISAGGGNIASDGRVKYLKIAHAHYPFAIEVNYLLHQSGSLHFANWNPQFENMRIEKAQFKVVDKQGDNFKYQEHNISTAKITSAGVSKTYEWNLENIPPFKFEPYNNSKEDYAPMVITAPLNFEMEGYVGDMSSWDSFATWIGKLNADRNDIANLEIPELDEEVNAVKSEKEKIAIVYNYLQKNTSYVSIQLGLGGWQPFLTSTVQEKKYGDCKALSFYTKALLEKYNIPSHYTLIRAGYGASPVIKEFPNAHFNHAILTVPLASDTLFLECTSQTNPFAFQGTFTGNRSALLIKENGGELVNTTYYRAEENLQKTKARIQLEENGSGLITLNRIYEGLEIENFGFLNMLTAVKSDQQSWLLKKYSWDNHYLHEFETIELKEGVIPSAGFKAVLSSQSAAKKMGKRLFISLGQYANSHLNRLTEDERKTAIKIRYGYQQMDTIEYRIPQNYSLESTFTPVQIETEFGTFSMQAELSDGIMVVYRAFKLNDGNYPPTDYQDFKSFVNAVLKEDSKQVVFLKQE